MGQEVLQAELRRLTAIKNGSGNFWGEEGQANALADGRIGPAMTPTDGSERHALSRLRHPEMGACDRVDEGLVGFAFKLPGDDLDLNAAPTDRKSRLYLERFIIDLIRARINRVCQRIAIKLNGKAVLADRDGFRQRSQGWCQTKANRSQFAGV